MKLMAFLRKHAEPAVEEALKRSHAFCHTKQRPVTLAAFLLHSLGELGMTFTSRADSQPGVSKGEVEKELLRLLDHQVVKGAPGEFAFQAQRAAEISLCEPAQLVSLVSFVNACMKPGVLTDLHSKETICSLEKLGVSFVEPHPREEQGKTAVVGNAIDTPDDMTREIQQMVKKSTVGWDDIGGLEKTKEEIQVAFAIASSSLPEGVKLDAPRHMLFYGPPGTGKTLLASAASKELSATFFNAKVSGVLSKYFGESSKLIAALFREARKQAPSCIFLDEVEALTPPRSSEVSTTEKRVLSTFLSELDGMESKSGSQQDEMEMNHPETLLCVIGATNAPWDIDSAVLSRFGKMIYVPLPDCAARRSILDIHLARKGFSCALSSKELEQLTEGYSGRDIQRLCGEAVSLMLKATNPDLTGPHGRGQTLKVRPISEDEMKEALRRIRPKADAELLARYEVWAGDVIG